MRVAVEDLSLIRLWIVYPGGERYPVAENITVLPLAEAQLLREHSLSAQV